MVACMHGGKRRLCCLVVQQRMFVPTCRTRCRSKSTRCLSPPACDRSPARVGHIRGLCLTRRLLMEHSLSVVEERVYRVGLRETFGQLLEGLHTGLGECARTTWRECLSCTGPASSLRWARAVSRAGARSATRRPRAYVGLQGAMLLAAGCTRTPTTSKGVV